MNIKHFGIRMLALVCIVSLMGCSAHTVSQPSSTGHSGFQKETSISNEMRLSAACQVDGGYYLQSDGLVYFMDATSGRMTPVCGKPECHHSDDTCNAWINSPFLSWYDGKLYYATSSLNTDNLLTLYSMNQDGTQHEKVQTIQLQGADWSTSYQPMLVGGWIYFMDSNSMLYRAKLGADVSQADLLFQENSSDILESTWKFWADGDNVYAMNHVLTSNGEYEDILYRLGEKEADTKEIWRSSDIGILGVDEFVSSWYITGGHLYYYFSGSDVWDMDLQTNVSAKLVDLPDTLQSGTAIFNDTNIFILDDQPDPTFGPQSPFRYGGKTIRVYTYQGELSQELDLQPIYQQYPDVVHCALVFADTEHAYVLAYCGMDISIATRFYRVSLESGDCTELDTWPGATNVYESTPSEPPMQIG